MMTKETVQELEALSQARMQQSRSRLAARATTRWPTPLLSSEGPSEAWTRTRTMIDVEASRKLMYTTLTCTPTSALCRHPSTRKDTCQDTGKRGGILLQCAFFLARHGRLFLLDLLLLDLCSNGFLVVVSLAALFWLLNRFG